MHALLLVNDAYNNNAYSNARMMYTYFKKIRVHESCCSALRRKAFPEANAQHRLSFEGSAHKDDACQPHYAATARTEYAIRS